MSQVYDDSDTMMGKIFIKKNNNKDYTKILNSISNIDINSKINQNIKITPNKPNKILFKYDNTPGNYTNKNPEDYQGKNIGKCGVGSQLNPNESSSKSFNFDEIENNKNKIKEINIEKIFDLEENNEYYKKFNDNKSKLYKI